MKEMAFREIPIPPGSSNVQGVAYDDAAGVLEIVFIRNNSHYRYFDVSGTVADGFTTSGLSAGQYHRQRILNQYGYEGPF